MGRRAKVRMLPESLREQVNNWLSEHQFSNYEGLSAWLEKRGFKIARSSLQRYGAAFEDKIELIRLATAQAREVVAVAPDREGAMSDALVSLVQGEIFKLLVECKGAIEKPDLAKIARAVADLARTTISQKRWREEMTERLKAQKAAAGGRISEVERGGGLSPEAEKEIRNILLGIDPLNTKILDGRAAEAAR